MDRVRELSVDLTDEMVRDIDAAIASGDYSTRDAVIVDALLNWKRLRTARGGGIHDL